MLNTSLFIMPQSLLMNGTLPIPIGSFEKYVETVASEHPSSLIFLQLESGVYPDALHFVLPAETDYESLEQESLDTILVSPDRDLAQQIEKSLHQYDRRTALTHDPVLPSSVESFLRVYPGSLPKILLLSPSLEGAEEQFRIGSLIRRALDVDQERVTVIVLGHLSSTHGPDAPGGPSRFAKEFDKEFVGYLEKENWDGFLYQDPFVLDEVGESLFKSVSLLLGLRGTAESVLKKHQLEYFLQAGVGYLFAELRLEV